MFGRWCVEDGNEYKNDVKRLTLQKYTDAWEAT